MGSDPLQQILSGLLGQLPKDGAIKEVVVETLDDGTRCETDVFRAANGSVLHTSTDATTAKGKEMKYTKVTCAHTRSMGKNLFPGVDPRADKNHRRLSSAQPATDLWVVGHVFLKRYSTFFDFEYGQVGFIRPLPSLNVGVQGAEVDAFTPDGVGISGDGLGVGAGISAGAIQTFEASSKAAGQAAHLRSAAAHLLGGEVDDDEEVRAAAPPGFVSGAGQINHGGLFMVAALVAVACAVFALRGSGSNRGSSLGLPIPCSNFANERRREPVLLEAGVSMIE